MNKENIQTVLEKLNSVTSPIPNREHEMVPNHGGGYGFDIGSAGVVKRFVLLGIIDGSVGAGHQALSKGVVAAMIELAQNDPGKFMEIILDSVDKGLRVSYRLAAYAIGVSYMPEDVRQMAYKHFNDIVKTGSDLLHFMSYIRMLGRGVGHGLRRAIARWYNDHDIDWLDYQLAKYRKRSGFSHTDVIRLAHPKPESDKLNAIFKYLSGKGKPPAGSRLETVRLLQFETDIEVVAEAVAEQGITWEMIPTNPWHQMPEFWEMMINYLPWNALLRHLHRYVKLPEGEARKALIDRLKRMNSVRTDVHPGLIMNAYFTLASSGRLPEWMDVALKGAFMRGLSSGSKHEAKVGIAVDTSGSMFFTRYGRFNQAMAMASATASSFPNHELVFFKSDAYVPKLKLPMSELAFIDYRFANDLGYLPGSRGLRERLRELGIKTGNTNPGAAIQHFTDNGHNLDAIVMITDEDANRGIHASLAFKEYKKKVNRNSKFIVVSLGNSMATLTDKNDPSQVTVVGWIPNIVDVVAGFIDI